MKKLSLFFAVTILFCGVSMAQLKKGDLVFGAGAGNVFSVFSKQNFDANMSMFGAKFVKNNLAFGAKLNAGSYGGAHQSTQTIYGMSVLGRYYFGNPNASIVNRARFFGEATAGLQHEIYSVDAGNVHRFGWGAGAGVNYFVTRNITLEGLVKYERLATAGNFSYDYGLNFQIGFSIHLPHK